MTDLSLIHPWSLVGQPDPLLLDRTLRVLRYTDSLATWGSKVLFTVLDPRHYPHVENMDVVQLPELPERKQWEIVVGKVMPAVLTQFPWTLSLHDDGFVIDMAMWHEGFLSYDYVAAPWPHNGLVGSGGVALTSRFFNKAIAHLPWYDGGINFDGWACRVHRQKMLELGIRFAPPEVAILFCTECTDNSEPSFAYHGRAHAVNKYERGWKQIEAWEKAEGLAA
jgi:hypothetical protein